MPTTSTSVTLGFGSVLVLAGLACLAVSFATDNWIVLTVDRAQAAQDGATTADLEKPIAFSRNRGLFRTCYEGNETVFLDRVPSKDKVDGNCLRERGYELSRRDFTTNYPSEYDTRIHLMRTHFALFIAGMFMLVAGVCVSMAGCFTTRVSVLQFAGLIVFVGAFLAACGMAIFHGYDYLEREKLDMAEVENLDILGEDWDTPDFPAYLESQAKYAELYDNTKREYGYSYMLGWISVGLSAIGGIMYLSGAFSYRPAREEPAYPEKNPYGYGNEGFEYPVAADYGGYPMYPAVSHYGGYGYFADSQNTGFI